MAQAVEATLKRARTTDDRDYVATTSATESAGRPSRKDEILASAAQVIAERGYKEATVRDIGDAAGILSGSLYYHFDSKEQIVLELLLPSVQAQYDEAAELRKTAESETDALVSLIRSSVTTTSENPYKTVILRNSGRTFEEFELLNPISELRRKTLGLWVDVVESGMQSGEFRDDIDPIVAVHGMLDGVLGAARWFIDSSSADLGSVIDSLTGLYVSGLTRS